MRRGHLRRRFLFAVMFCLLAGTAFAESSKPSAASSFQVIYAFQGTPDASGPGALTPDGQGNFYGTAGGGTYGEGSIFELKHTTDGWEEQVIYSFTGQQNDAGAATGLTLDGAGNLYALSDGYPNSSPYVFKLAPNGHGGWTKSVIYTFEQGSGNGVQSNLVIDPKGNIFGVLSHAGLPQRPADTRGWSGAVFELLAQGNGEWKEVAIHPFAGSPDGWIPVSAALDSAGNVWGMTMAGGTHRCRFYDGLPGCGIAYELTPSSGGKWTESVVYDFARGGGSTVNPSNGLLLESAGHIIGTSLAGGDGVGSVFELIQSQGGWEEKVLYRFVGIPDCFDPLGPLQMNSAGALLGTCSRGGAGGDGTVYELIPTKVGEWTEKILHSFTGQCGGNGPQTGVVIDSHGAIYGTTWEGGTGCLGCGCGTVFEILPNGQ